MKIKKIKLENIRSHTDTEICLDQGITVFTGRTGCGKSTVLMAIQFALFGSDSTLSNSSLLRRGKTKGHVELEFEENNSTFRIIRGIKKQGKNITVDRSNMEILKDGKPLPLLGRANDLNEKILEILQYPSGVKARELFEITSYTKQDEIRALVELKPEKRQEYIDKILQLSKYKTTWENLRDIITHFEKEFIENKTRIEDLKKDKKELQENLKKKNNLANEIKENEKVSKEYEKEFKKYESKRKEMDQKIEKLLEKRRLIDKNKGAKESLENDIQRLEKQVSLLDKRKESLISEKKEFKEIQELTQLENKKIDHSKQLEVNKEQIRKIEKELEDIQKLGEGTCPICKQKVSSKHISDIEKEYSQKRKELQESIVKTEKELKKLSNELESAKKLKTLKESIQKVNENLKEKNESLCEKKESLKRLKRELANISFNEKKYETLKKEFDKIEEKEKEFFSELQSKQKINKILSKNLKDLDKEIKEKQKDVNALEKIEKGLGDFENSLTVLKRMRDDIRNIREVVRRNFLEDFRQEFQRKFEEIRKYEEEYSVDVKLDYEPIAYTSKGEEVSIESMSGGEKTSVALAYRLALSDLAAQVSDIRQSEVLILDEPTVGFDKDDVKALPDALRNVKTIPQMIIVTHEEELQNAADYIFRVEKIGTVSEVKAKT